MELPTEIRQGFIDYASKQYSNILVQACFSLNDCYCFYLIINKKNETNLWNGSLSIYHSFNTTNNDVIIIFNN